MARRMIPKSVPPRTLLEFSMRALLNADELATDAEALASKERWPRAVALLILAGEELGKAYFAWLLSIGAIQEKPDSISVLLSAHHKKQALAHLPDWSWLEELMRTVFEGISPRDFEVDLMTEEGKRAYKDLLGRLAIRMNAAKVDPRSVAAAVAEAQSMWGDVVDKGTRDRLRQRALFVDISEDGMKVLSPSEIDLSQYDVLRREFKATYSKVRDLIPQRVEDGWIERIRIAMACNRDVKKPTGEGIPGSQ